MIRSSFLGLQATFWLQLLVYDLKSGDIWGVGCLVGGGSRFPGVGWAGSQQQGAGPGSRLCARCCSRHHRRRAFSPLPWHYPHLIGGETKAKREQ